MKLSTGIVSLMLSLSASASALKTKVAQELTNVRLTSVVEYADDNQNEDISMLNYFLGDTDIQASQVYPVITGRITGNESQSAQALMKFSSTAGLGDSTGSGIIRLYKNKGKLMGTCSGTHPEQSSFELGSYTSNSSIQLNEGVEIGARLLIEVKNHIFEKDQLNSIKTEIYLKNPERECFKF